MDTRGPYLDVDDCAALHNAICEIGGMEAPYLKVSLDNPRVFSMSNFVTGFTAPSSIQMTHAYTKQPVVATLLNSGGATFNYLINSNTPGLLTFSLSSSTSGVSETYSVQYLSPEIDVIYPTLTKLQLITIVGNNFGITANGDNISVTLGSGNPCLTPLVTQGRVITCTLNDQLSNSVKILPITIKVNGISQIVGQIPYWSKTMKKFYMGIVGSIPYANVPAIAANLTAVNNKGTFYYPVNNPTFIQEFLFIVSQYLSNSWSAYVGAVYDPSKKFKDPITGEFVTVYSNINTYVSEPSCVDLMVSPTVLTAIGVGTCGSMFQFGGEAPSITSASLSFLSPTAGGTFNFTIDKVGSGHYYSTLGLSQGSTVVRRADFFDMTILQLVIPAGAGSGPFNMGNLVIDGYTGSQVLIFSYMSPSITKTTQIPIQGGTTTIYGDNFSDNIGNVQVLVDNVVVTGTITMFTTHTMLTAVVPPNTVGNHSLVVKVKGQTSAAFNLKYYIQTTVSSYQQTGDNVQVTGTNFGSECTVYISSDNTLTNISVIPTKIQELSLSFQLPPNSKNGGLSVLCQGNPTPAIPLTITPIVDSVAPTVSLDGGNFTITGSFMATSNMNGQALNYQVQLYSDANLANAKPVNCSYLSTQAPYTITCAILPGTGTFYGKLSISNRDVLFNHTYTPPKVTSASELEFGKAGYTNINGDNFANVSLKVTVGDETCSEVQFVDRHTVRCFFSATIAPTKTDDSLNVTVSVDGLVGPGSVFFYKRHIPCPATENGECNGHGTCSYSSGICECQSPYILPNCTSQGSSGEMPTTDPNGGIIIPSKEYNFTIQLYYFREMNNLGTEVLLVPMAHINWLNRSQDGPTIVLAGSLANSTIRVELNLTVYKEAAAIQFAGETINVQANSVKSVIKVVNWPFTSQLNTLQVVYIQVANKQYDSGCAVQDTGAESNQDANGGSLSYMQLNAGSTIVTARYANRIYVDNNIFRSNIQNLPATDPLYQLLPQGSEDKFSLLTAINVPHFTQSTVIDPNFGSLVQGSAASCTKENKWKIPVIVVCSVVGAALLTLLALFIIKKKHITLRSVQISLKSFD
ncbi:hypothetical protein SAMD00019534_018300 [Acytostelium subglobosum LB1]|uniref:hypothetical protein n=1 Tax=Acytostelium subglobosum LB1 TaxID=1410327 RepID=UPI000645133C|nr:hypothetical protein SAMD00019534_018300 [Acytostelium subglobosum LB1]GAM18655.1 hypothetical protein SAMD00019534_018300 [Acytostelium subglobosum LB1]|eukprot:XP_012757875.1 hypothetical protein SAMD00019534_018300 [Acytostelium subglobosum LB1]